MNDHDHPDVIYEIDRFDRLRTVDDNWLRFAERNDASANLRPDQIVGSSLWLHIRDETLQAIYKSLLAVVRTQGRSVDFDFRCDSPLLRRFMRMTISLTEEQGVRFVSRTMRTERRNTGIASGAVYAGATNVIRCSVCNLFRIDDGTWHEVTGAVGRGGIMDRDTAAQIIWTVCESCRESALQNPPRYSTPWSTGFRGGTSAT